MGGGPGLSHMKRIGPWKWQCPTNTASPNGRVPLHTTMILKASTRNSHPGSCPSQSSHLWPSITHDSTNLTKHIGPAQSRS